MDGKPSAYRSLYDRYAKAMFNTALRIVGRVPDAEDILQESFADAFIQLKSFENKSTFGAWLKQIVVYKSINFLKKKKLSLIDLDNTGDVADEDESDSYRIDEEALWFTVDMIKQNILELPDGYRTVLTLYLLEGYDHEEIAEILNVAQSTVRTQYIRAKQKLLSLLKENALYE